jgi:predicted ATPase
LGVPTLEVEIKRVEAAGDYSPEEVYRERRDRFRRDFEAETARWNGIANMRLLAFVLAAVGIVWGLWAEIAPLWIGGLVALAAFFGLVWYHNRVGRERRRHEMLCSISEEALLRLARAWDELPVRHSLRSQAGEPYAGDLDIFGHASLFHLLDTVGTQMGEETLGRWLRAPASPEEVKERQEAVAELAALIDLRDELQLRGRLAGEEKADPRPFLEWAEGKPWLRGRTWLVVWAWITPVVVWPLLVAHLSGLIAYPYWLPVVIVNLALTLNVVRPVQGIMQKASSAEKGFRHFAESFEVLSGSNFRSSALQRIQERLTVDNHPDSGTQHPTPDTRRTAHGLMRHFYRLTTLVIPPSAALYIPWQAATLWDVHLLGAFERWQARAGHHAREWLEALGEAEALSALAGLRHAHPRWALPEIDPVADRLRGEELGHPLIPDGRRVDNDVEVGSPGTFLLVTGSNMSGKSTLLRAIGVNVVLANAGGPVCARSLRLPPVALWTSMRVEDSLERGVSFFMAELQRLKAVVDAAHSVKGRGERRLLYLLDEILQGTNTAERQIAARRIIAHLVKEGAIGAVSTHDLTLADNPDLQEAARMVHFTETIREGAEGMEMSFDYKLRPGIATSTNALKLMEIVGLDLD